MKTTTMKWMGGLAAVIFCLSVIAPDASAELVGYWNFDDNVDDKSGNGNQGTIVGGAPYSTDTPGLLTPSTKSISFDGVDDYVLITHNAHLPINPTPAWTLSMWVKGAGDVGAANADDRVFSESSTLGNPLFNLGTRNNGTTAELDFFYRPGGPHQFSNGLPFDGEWHHIAWVDVEATGGAVLYVDGVEDTTFTYTRVDLASTMTTIGGILRTTPCCLFTGNIDDVALWNEALTPAAIEALADGASPLIPEPSTFALGLLASLGLSMYARRRRRA